MKLFAKKQSDVPRRRVQDGNINSVPESSGDIFRRNRTLQNAKPIDDTDYSSRTHVHHLAGRRRRIAGVLVATASIAMLLWLIVSNFTATAFISVPGADISKTLDKQKYEQVIEQYLEMHPLSRLHFVMNQADLLSYVSGKLPEVSDIKQRGITSVGKTDFAISVRMPVAGWRISNQQYYVDAKGVSFATNYFTEPSVQIIDKNDTVLDTGSAIASNRFLSFVGQVVATAADSGYVVTEAIIPVNTTRELDIKLKGISILVKLSIDRSVGEQIEDMNNALNYFNKNGLKPTYVDIRVSGKAFYS